MQTIEYNFYCSNHGKSLCDGHTGTYKSQCRHNLLYKDVEYLRAEDIAGRSACETYFIGSLTFDLAETRKLANTEAIVIL